MLFNSAEVYTHIPIYVKTHIYMFFFICLGFFTSVSMGSEFTCYVRLHMLCDPRKHSDCSQFSSKYYDVAIVTPVEQLMSVKLTQSFSQSLASPYFSLLLSVIKYSCFDPPNLSTHRAKFMESVSAQTSCYLINLHFLEIPSNEISLFEGKYKAYGRK